MPLKIQSKLSIEKITEDAEKRFFKEAQKELPDVIREYWNEGKTPVQGSKNFKSYSDSYKRKIRKAKSGDLKNKSVTPVNLKLSGKLHKSFVAKIIRKGKNRAIELFFKGRDNKKLAVIHDQAGAGKSKVRRRMIPSETNEKFKRPINKLIRELLDDAVKRAIKRFRR